MHAKRWASGLALGVVLAALASSVLVVLDRNRYGHRLGRKG